MKKRLYHITTLLVLTVYSVFSTGVFISIHHCCNHCNPVEMDEYCACESHSSHGGNDCACHQNGNEHHKCYDVHYLFKILDSYDKDEYTPPPVIFYFVLYLVDDYRDLYVSNIIQETIKENERSRSGPVIPCDSFFKYTHQLVVYV